MKKTFCITLLCALTLKVTGAAHADKSVTLQLTDRQKQEIVLGMLLGVELKQFPEQDLRSEPSSTDPYLSPNTISYQQAYAITKPLYKEIYQALQASEPDDIKQRVRTYAQLTASMEYLPVKARREADKNCDPKRMAEILSHWIGLITLDRKTQGTYVRMEVQINSMIDPLSLGCISCICSDAVRRIENIQCICEGLNVPLLDDEGFDNAFKKLTSLHIFNYTPVRQSIKVAENAYAKKEISRADMYEWVNLYADESLKTYKKFLSDHNAINEK